jgi:hypothetical protein
MNNTNSIAYKTEQARKDYEDLKNNSFKQFESGRYQQVS